MKRSFFYLILAVIAALSFRIYSSVFFPLFNSDDGITVLMLHYFDIKTELYLWQQDRAGSIIPLIGQVFYKGMGINSLWSESITHLIILLVGYFSLASFLKTNFSKIIFAIIWFLPIPLFSGLTRFTFGLQYSLIGIGLYLINRYQNSNLSKNKPFIRWLHLIGIFIIFTAAVWVSDSAVITVGIVLMVLAWSYFKKGNRLYNIPKFEFIYSIGSFVLGLIVILLLKKTALIQSENNYNKQLFNSFSDVIASLSIIKDRLVFTFTFEDPNIFISIYAYLALILLGLTVFVKIKGKISESQKKWFYIFLIDGTILILIILLSHWAFGNRVHRRYFVTAYIAYWLGFLIWSENITIKKSRTFVQTTSLFISLIGFVSILYGYSYVFPKRLTPQADIAREFEQLGKIGIISNYWKSYSTSFVNPDLIKATPHDRSFVRNYALVDSVFSQPRIFIIKDSWLESFPDTLKQFGYVLVKKDSSFSLGDCTLNEYKKIKRNEILPFKSFNLKEGVISADSAIVIYKDRDNLKNSTVVWGPYSQIGSGSFNLKYTLNVENFISNTPQAMFDVVVDYGQKILTQKELIIEKPDSNEFVSFELPFSTDRRYSNIEFRIHYYGHSDLTIKKIQLLEK